MPEQPAPRPDRGPSKHSSTTSIAREAYCRRGFKQERSHRRRRRRTTFPTPLEQSDDGSSSLHPRMKDQPDYSRRKTEKFIHVQDLDKLVQKRVEEASMSHHCRFNVIATDASNSPFSDDILEI